jgi:hypothetical protein
MPIASTESVNQLVLHMRKLQHMCQMPCLYQLQHLVTATNKLSKRIDRNWSHVLEEAILLDVLQGDFENDRIGIGDGRSF